MRFTPLIKTGSRRAAAIGMFVGLLLLAGARTTAADGDEAPIIISAFPNAPGMVTLEWVHTGDDVFWFVVEVETPFAYWTPDRDKRVWSVTGLEPSTTYRFRVCAVYDFNRVCSDEDNVGYVSITTLPPQQQPPPPPPAPVPPPRPMLTATARSGAEIYLTWQFPGYQARLTGAELYRDGAVIYEAVQPGNFDSDHVDVVQPNSTHRYHLCFRNPDGETCSTPITASPVPSSRPPGGSLTAPRNVQETQSRDGVTLTWEVGTGATYHQVQCVDISNGGRCGLLYTTADGHRGIAVAGEMGRQNLWEVTSYTLKDLSHPNYYVVRVCSANEGDGAGQMPDPTACAPDTVIFPRPFGTVDYGGDGRPAPNGCTGGNVWRWAFEGDRVCVEPARTIQVIADNAQAAARRSPTGGAYGPNTCLQGYVWREAFDGDVVCVTPEERTRVAAENAAAGRR